MYSDKTITGMEIILGIFFLYVAPCEMVLTINGGQALNEAPADSSTFFKNYQSFKDINNKFSSIQAKEVGPEWNLFVLENEMAVITPHEKTNNIIGSEDATASIIFILRHTASEAIGFAHLNSQSSQIEEAINHLVQKILELSQGAQGKFELHLAGGMTHESTEETFKAILNSCIKQTAEIDLKLACIGEFNTVNKDGVNWPIVQGVGVDVRTGDIFPATFPKKEPNITLRFSKILVPDHIKIMDVYDNNEGLFIINPFNYANPDFGNGAKVWLQKSDQEILHQFSITPDAEIPFYLLQTKDSLKFIRDNSDPTKSVFKDNKPVRFKRDQNTGLWIPV